MKVWLSPQLVARHLYPKAASATAHSPATIGCPSAQSAIAAVTRWPLSPTHRPPGVRRIPSQTVWSAWSTPSLALKASRKTTFWGPIQLKIFQKSLGLK